MVKDKGNLLENLLSELLLPLQCEFLGNIIWSKFLSFKEVFLKSGPVPGSIVQLNFDVLSVKKMLQRFSQF